MPQYPSHIDIAVYGLPTNPSIGVVAVDPADGKLKKYNGSSWVSVENTLSDINNALLQNFDVSILSDFTQTGLNLVTVNTLNGARTAQLIAQAAVNQSFKQVFPVTNKFRGKNLTLMYDVISTITSGNATITIYDETNLATLVNSALIPTGSQSIAATVTNASTTIIASNSIVSSLSIGRRVTGVGIPSNTIITALNASTGTITLSQAATSSGTSIRVSDTVKTQKISFDVPASCSSLSYTITALPEANLPEIYIDDIYIGVTTTALASTNITVPTITDNETIIMRTGAPFANVAGVATLIPFTTIESILGAYSLTSNAVTIKYSGKYKVTLKGETGANAESVSFYVNKNGGLYTQIQQHTL